MTRDRVRASDELYAEVIHLPCTACGSQPDEKCINPITQTTAKTPCIARMNAAKALVRRASMTETTKQDQSGRGGESGDAALAGEPRVSDEDRSEALLKVAESIQGAAHGRAAARKAKLAVDALVSHGWGPKPRVSPTKLGEFIDAANAGGMAVPWRALQDYLRECGIEVTR